MKNTLVSVFAVIGGIWAFLTLTGALLSALGVG